MKLSDGIPTENGSRTLKIDLYHTNVRNVLMMAAPLSVYQRTGASTVRAYRQHDRSADQGTGVLAAY
jgi:hypothetical protein